MTVAELIEKLKEFDQNLPVVKHDCCYGYDEVEEPYETAILVWEAYGTPQHNRQVVEIC